MGLHDIGDPISLQGMFKMSFLRSLNMQCYGFYTLQTLCTALHETYGITKLNTPNLKNEQVHSMKNLCIGGKGFQANA